MMSFLTFKFRIKSGERHLRRKVAACNRIWNFCVETQREAQRRRAAGRKTYWPTAFDLIKLTAGSNAALGIHSDVVEEICKQFARSRDQQRRCPRFRASFGPKRALGWMPFRSRSVRVAGNTVTHYSQRFTFWKSRDVPATVRAGAFAEDARGRWYVTFQCEVADDLPTGQGAVGIDLGLKELAALSDGSKIPALQHYRQYETQLATAQRARNKKRVRAIHAKIANARRHHLHEQSTRIARDNGVIAVGNVSSASLARTRMAKSVLDAGWSSFRHMLRYKASRHGAVFIEAGERWTSQTCSACGSIPVSSPKGMGALGMRRWECSDCGADHDRDVNAARNILRVGLECQPPGEEIATRATALTNLLTKAKREIANA